MAAKTKCPACGAKNDMANHRCRICTAVINPNAAAPPAEEPVTPLGIDHFDADEINRQIRPARERFGSDSGALAARLAAARGESPAPLRGGPDASFPPESPFTPAPSFGAERTFGQEPAFADPAPRASTPATSAPIEYDDEPFDPDALFRDLG